MNPIRFSHDYPKLWNQKTAKLVAVETVTVSDGLNPSLKEYDTKTVEGGYFHIADGEYLQLVFVGDLGIPFSTLRKMNYENLDYYKSHVGKWFEVVIEGESK